MILCLTDEYATLREVEGSDAGIVVHRLPGRPTTAAAFTGRWVATEVPDTVVVATSLIDDASDRTAIVCRFTIGEESWIPDVLFEHECETLSVVAGQQQDGDARVAPAAAAAAAAAVAVLAPARVLFIATGSAAKSRLPQLVVDLGNRSLERYERGKRRSEGGPHVSQAVRLGGELSDRLRLTATQRVRFLQTVRAAAIRGGELPPPLSEESPARTNTKAEAKKRLAELEQRLEEWKRAGV